MKTRPELAILRLEPRHAAALTEFLAQLAHEGAEACFHPHPFDAATAARITAQSGADLYLGAFTGETMVGYGLLRGWDEGFAIPSLGLAVRAGWRRRGVGRRLLEELHTLAAARGAARVRLTVHAENAGAIRLYRATGYRFVDETAARWVGFRELTP